MDPYECKCWPTKRCEGNCTEKYLRELKNHYGEDLVNACESNILESHS